MVFIINSEEDSIKVKELLKEKGVSNEAYLSPIQAYLSDECDTAMENILCNLNDAEIKEFQNKYDVAKGGIVDELLECSDDLDGLFCTVYEKVKEEILK